MDRAKFSFSENPSPGEPWRPRLHGHRHRDGDRRGRDRPCRRAVGPGPPASQCHGDSLLSTVAAAAPGLRLGPGRATVTDSAVDGLRVSLRVNTEYRHSLGLSDGVRPEAEAAVEIVIAECSTDS